MSFLRNRSAIAAKWKKNSFFFSDPLLDINFSNIYWINLQQPMSSIYVLIWEYWLPDMFLLSLVLKTKDASHVCKIRLDQDWVLHANRKTDFFKNIFNGEFYKGHWLQTQDSFSFFSIEIKKHHIKVSTFVRTCIASDSITYDEID